MVLVTLKSKKLLELFTKRYCKEQIVKALKGDKLYVKWKAYHSSFNSWIDKKRHSINE